MQENEFREDKIIEGEIVDKKSSVLFYISLLIILSLLIVGGFYLYMMIKSEIDSPKDTEIVLIQQEPQTSLSASALQNEIGEIERLKMELENKNRQIKQLEQKDKGTISEAVRERLRYVIRPKERVIAECHTMSVGFWQIPDNCALLLAANVNKELENDKRVVAFEVQGIVDTTPYRGLSPELKQEGLASFRAHVAIKLISQKLPNAVTFEGESLQEANKRGYRVKAYFVE